MQSSSTQIATYSLCLRFFKVDVNRFDIPLFSVLQLTHVILHKWVVFCCCCFYRVFAYPSKCCTYGAGTAGATWNCCRIGAFCVRYTTVHRATWSKPTYIRCMRVGIAVLPAIYTFALPRDLSLCKAISFTTHRVNYNNVHRTTLLAVSLQQQIALWSPSLIKRHISIVKTHLKEIKGNKWEKHTEIIKGPAVT